MSDKLTIEIDAKTLYDSIKDLGNKMDDMIKHQKVTNGRVNDLEEDFKPSGRIGKLETFHTKTLAIWTVIVTFGGVIVDKVIAKLS